MKVKIEISEEYDPAYAVIYTKAVTEEIQKVSDLLQQDNGPVTASEVIINSGILLTMTRHLFVPIRDIRFR